MRRRIRIAVSSMFFALGAWACLSPLPGEKPQPVAAGLEIRGRAVYSTGEPMADARVLVNGSLETTTAADGAFSFSDVVAPYDLVLEETRLGKAVPGTILIYAGLTRSDPTVTWSGDHDVPQGKRFSVVGGTVTGGANWPWPDGTRTEVTVVSADAPLAGWSDAKDGKFQVSPIWFGAEHIMGSVHALQACFGPEALAGFAYGFVDARELDNAGKVTDYRIDLQPVPTEPVRVRIDLPNRQCQTQHTWRVRVASSNSLEFRRQALPVNTAFTVDVPAHPDLAMEFEVDAAPEGGAGAASVRQRFGSGAKDVLIHVPEVPELLSPRPGELSAPPRFTLRWRPAEGLGIIEIEVSADDGYPTQRLTVYGAGAEWTFPDLSKLGIPPPAANRVNWYAKVIRELTSSDDCAGGNLTNVLDRLDTLTTASAAPYTFRTGQ